MNKLIIALLIIGAAAGIYFLVFKKKPDDTIIGSIEKELIVGKWKIAIDPGEDSLTARSVTYEFQNDGSVLFSDDSLSTRDTSFYSWTKDNLLAWKKNNTDSIVENFIVRSLTKDSLQLQAADSSLSFFIRSK